MLKNAITLLLLLLVNTAFAQPQRFADIVEEYRYKHDFSGTVMVAINGEIDFIKNIGLANREHRFEISSATKFKIASVTKTFTAVLVMKLVEEGKIKLDGTLGEYLPKYAGEGKDRVTIHHLLTYSAGIENKLGAAGMQPYQTGKTIDEFIRLYCSGELIFEPGEKSEYGNTGYILLHKIIEEVSKQSFGSYLEEIILTPLGMKNTNLVNSSEITDGLCSGYLYNDSLRTFYQEKPHFTALYFGSGAMYSTAEDLLAFDQALFKYNILKKETTDIMLKVYPEYGYTAYGLWGSTGWGNFKEAFYYRTGSIQGANANWIHTIDSGKTIIVVSNSNAVNLYELSEKLYVESLKE